MQVLFLCSGNYYRSRFSELFFNDRMRKLGIDYRADSRGLALHSHQNIGPMAQSACIRLEELGVEIPDPLRFPASAVAADFEAAELVVAVKEAEHRAMMREQFPEWENRIEYWRIDDIDVITPAQMFPRLEAKLEELIARLTAEIDAVGGLKVG